MTEFNDYTKPSRVKHRLKRRWRKKTAQRLTVYRALPDNRRVINALMAGRGNLFSYGEKSPQPFAVFFCPSILRGVMPCLSSMAGLLGQRSALAGSITQFSTPFKSVAHAVESMIGGYQSSVMESPL